jgi:small G protein signaling modulator 3
LRRTSTRGTSPASTRSRKRPKSVTGAAPAAPPPSLTAVLSVGADTPRHACANVVRRLLSELTEIHDERQATQRREWDAFVRARRKAKAAAAPRNTNAQHPGTGGGAAAVLGLGTALDEEELEHHEGLIGFAQLGLSGTKDERRELERLVRAGIPLAYRSKVWLECSGGLELREPGVFRDLLADDGQADVLVEIEKDVGRTMPLNVFFGGNGAGVEKLRRVLIAYSR